MARRLFIATLGFHENFIIRTLNSSAAQAGEGLLPVSLKPSVSGVISAYNNLKSIASRLGVRVYELLELDPDPPKGIVKFTDTVINKIGSGNYNFIIADLTGGPRIIGIIVYTSLILLSTRINVEVRMQSDVGGGWDARIDGRFLKLLRTPMGERSKVLRYIALNPGCTISDIASALGVSPKTAANYTASLKKLGLVVQKGRGRGLYLSEWGYVLAYGFV